MTIDVDVETLIANHLDGEVLDGVTLTLDSNLFAGPLRPAGTQDDEGATLVSVYVHRRGGAGSDRVDWFSGQGGSDVTTTVAVIVRGDPGEYDEHEALCRAVVEYLHLNPPTATSIIDVVSITPYTPAQRSDTGSGVAPLTELLFSVRYITDGASSSVPSQDLPAGGDLDGTYPDPEVIAVHAGGSSGTRLTIGAISDGQYVARSGTSLIGVAVPVPASRLISTTAPLQGGGDLSADRTLSLADSGASAGSYGSSSSIPALTVTAKGLISSISASTLTIAHITAGGDLAASFPSPSVVALHFGPTRIALSSSSPTSGQVLSFDGTNIVGTSVTTSSIGAVPTTRTLTGTAPITVGGVSGTPQDLSADRTIAHATSGVTAATYGDKNNPTLIAVSSTGHVTSAEDYRVLDDTVMWRTLSSYGQWSTSNLGSPVEDTPVSGSIADTQVNYFVTSASVTAIKRLGATPPRLRWDGSTRGYVCIWVLCPVAIPGTGTTLVTWGLMNLNPSGTTLPSSGCYFAFLSTTSGTKVLCVTANSGTTTVTTTSVDWSLNVMREYRIELAKDRSSVVFIIDGTTVATHTSNLPATSILLANMQTDLRTSATAASLGVGLARTTLIAKL